MKCITIGYTLLFILFFVPCPMKGMESSIDPEAELKALKKKQIKLKKNLQREETNLKKLQHHLDHLQNPTSSYVKYLNEQIETAQNNINHLNQVITNNKNKINQLDKPGKELKEKTID